jgi:hypothetical protein
LENPKSETRNPKEIPSPMSEGRWEISLRARTFGIPRSPFLTFALKVGLTFFQGVPLKIASNYDHARATLAA